MTENTVRAATAERPTDVVSRPPSCLIQIYPTGGQLGHRFELADEVAVIGRDDGCDVCAAETSVSRRHARIDPAPGGHMIEDLTSTNGTFVNDRLLAGPAPLRDGDLVRTGNCIYKYLAGGNLEAAYHEELYRMATTDGLTQVHNRRYFAEHLEAEAARSRRHGRPLSVLIFDVDHFKRVNDTHGHLGGDMVLREMAARLRGTVREADLLARYGGEEFAMVLAETPPAEAAEAGERVRALVAARPFPFEGAAIPVTVSVGVAGSGGADLPTAARLLALADARLYRAKQAGRNRVVSDTPEGDVA